MTPIPITLLIRWHELFGMACGGAGFEPKQLNIFNTKE